MGVVVVAAVLGFVQLIYWLIVKGVIFVMWNLFQINWYGKFWVVYLFLFLIGLIFGSRATYNNKGK
jgi:hypothetical protein